MLPFCGYNMGDYFAHWLSIGERAGAQLPKIFYVNWFRRGTDNKFLWPGYGENSRVLKWIVERVHGTGKAVDTPIGRLPAAGALDLSGLSVNEATMRESLRVDVEGWRAEIPSIREHYERFGGHCPRRCGASWRPWRSASSRASASRQARRFSSAI
jgi:phosphoenolpyruvate carboxykinase (GTP)